MEPLTGRTVGHQCFKPLQFITVSRPSSELLGVGVGVEPGLTSALLSPLRPLCERRKFLHDNMVEIPNRIMFSEMKRVAVSEGPTLGSVLFENKVENPLGQM